MQWWLGHCERMSRFLVPFHMHSSGWLVVAYCYVLGIWLSEWWHGLAVAALLVASLLLHEVGHILAATLLGVQVREFGLCIKGAYNRRAPASRRRDEVLISTAGPLMNLILVFPLMFVPRIGTPLALCNLMLCVFNLLPLPSSDGLRILRTLSGTKPAGGMIPVLSGPRPAL